MKSSNSLIPLLLQNFFDESLYILMCKGYLISYPFYCFQLQFTISPFSSRCVNKTVENYWSTSDSFFTICLRVLFNYSFLLTQTFDIFNCFENFNCCIIFSVMIPPVIFIYFGFEIKFCLWCIFKILTGFYDSSKLSWLLTEYISKYASAVSNR